MNLLDKIGRRKVYELSVDGWNFRAVVTPANIAVKWVDCPSPFVPAGYVSAKMIGFKKRPSLFGRAQRWWKEPLATEQEVREDIAGWLEGTLEDAAKDGVDLGR